LNPEEPPPERDAMYLAFGIDGLRRIATLYSPDFRADPSAIDVQPG
jgi:hypothetical protein